MGFFDTLKDMFTLDSFYAAPEENNKLGDVLQPMGPSGNGATVSTETDKPDPFATNLDLTAPPVVRPQDPAASIETRDTLSAAGALPQVAKFIEEAAANGQLGVSDAPSLALADRPTDHEIPAIKTPTPEMYKDTDQMPAVMEKSGPTVEEIAERNGLPSLNFRTQPPEVRRQTVDQLNAIVGGSSRAPHTQDVLVRPDQRGQVVGAPTPVYAPRGKKGLFPGQ